ncbi:hypothetical protein [Trinickia dabaoshanensis]|uniref:hypothetical protein n=1 Tax=Trinickia dabaoshanensis TaxID=564714 RepID=UPI0018EE3A66|nr:hypothetical protein [Trinickia dabaoshanensis]
MHNKGIAGTSGASSAQHEQPAQENTARQPRWTPPAGAHSVRTTDSRLQGLPSARRGPLPLTTGDIDDESDGHESDESESSTLFHGAPSSRFGSTRMRLALETDFPSMRATVPQGDSGAEHGQTSAAGGQARTETGGAPSGGGRSLTAPLQHLYGKAAELGTRAKNAAATGLTAAKDGVVATVEGGGQLLSAGAHHAAQVGTSAVSGLRVLGVPPRLVGAAAGHLVHQTVSTGLPTFAREMMYEAIYAALRQLPPHAVSAMQVATGVTTLGLHRLRQVREQRNPEVAARGFHNLSAAQWEALPHEEKQAKMKAQRDYSDAVMSLAMSSVVTNVALSFGGASIGQPHLGAQVLATDLKVMAYAAARDSIQASFRMVNTEQETNGGVSGAHLGKAAAFYGGANFAANYAFGAVPAGLSDARTTLDAKFGDKDAQAALAAHPSPLSMGQALGTFAHSSAVKATINTLLETSDWIHVTQQEANEAGTRQVLDPALTGVDYGRVLDQSVTRTAVIGSNISLGNALGIVAQKLHAPAWLSGLMTNGATAVWAGATYSTIARTWQAESAVRSAVREAQTNRRSNDATPEAAAETDAPRGDENV